MEYHAWPCPPTGGRSGEESALLTGTGNTRRLLVLPPLFDEANKLRRQIVETMRRLARHDVASILPDLPGCNDSLRPHGEQTLSCWREAAAAAAEHFDATHVLALRSGAWLAPPNAPGWLVAPSKPAPVLRGLIRARTIAAREAGREENADSLLAAGRTNGIECAGWMLGAELVREMESLVYAPPPAQRVVAQEELGGAGLWLRAEPGYDLAQADALAALVALEIAP